ncbi:MAG: hypothetical protein VYE15_02175 [Myxococcota bacterium]|nr:hypothetical protein [Myxococcota bacterium]
MTTGQINGRLKWTLAAAISLLFMSCVEPRVVSVNTSGAGAAVSGPKLIPEQGATVVGVSTGGGWTLRARTTSALVQGQSAGAGLRLKPSVGNGP